MLQLVKAALGVHLGMPDISVFKTKDPFNYLVKLKARPFL